MLASDDLDVPEYTVIEDDKPDLEMIGLADERYAESEAGKERRRKINCAVQDIDVEKKLFGKGAR